MRQDYYRIKMPPIRIKDWYGENVIYDVQFPNSMALRKQIEELAIYFKREFGYDFVQCSAHDNLNSKKCQGVAWCERVGVSYDKAAVYAAACFRFRDYTNAPSKWALQWVWIHPYHRNKGLFTKQIPHFRARFGDFDIEPPLSKAMHSIVKKHVNWDAGLLL